MNELKQCLCVNFIPPFDLTDTLQDMQQNSKCRIHSYLSFKMLEWHVWSLPVTRGERQCLNIRCVSLPHWKDSPSVGKCLSDLSSPGSSYLGRQTGLSPLSTSGCNARSTRLQPSLIILAILAWDPCHKNDMTKQFCSFLCTSAGQTAVPLALSSSLLDISHSGTCSALHPFLPCSHTFWSVCWRVSGTLPLWAAHLSSASSLGYCCEPPEELSAHCETCLCP